jgi:hypothetical protein
MVRRVRFEQPAEAATYQAIPNVGKLPAWIFFLRRRGG